MTSTPPFGTMHTCWFCQLLSKYYPFQFFQRLEKVQRTLSTTPKLSTQSEVLECLQEAEFRDELKAFPCSDKACMGSYYGYEAGCVWFLLKNSRSDFSKGGRGRLHAPLSDSATGNSLNHTLCPMHQASYILLVPPLPGAASDRV